VVKYCNHLIEGVGCNVRGVYVFSAAPGCEVLRPGEGGGYVVRCSNYLIRWVGCDMRDVHISSAEPGCGSLD
jgi:hypothetical protein